MHLSEALKAGDLRRESTLDSAGNLYGTAREGGDLNCSPTIGGALVGCGVVFEFTASGSYVLLHAFAGGETDGAAPSSIPVLDGQGNVYGATSDGGPANFGVIYGIGPGQASNLPGSSYFSSVGP